VVLVEEDPGLLGRLEDDLRRAGADPRRTSTPAGAAPGEIVLVEAPFASVASRLAEEIADGPALVRLAPLSARAVPRMVLELLADLSGADLLIRFPQEDFVRAGKFSGPLADFPPHLRRVVEGCSAFFADERHGWLLAWREAARAGGDEAALTAAVERLRGMLGNGGEERIARAARLEGAGGAGVHVLLSTPHPEHALELNGAVVDGGAPLPAPSKKSAGRKAAAQAAPPAAPEPVAQAAETKPDAPATVPLPDAAPSSEILPAPEPAPSPEILPAAEAAPSAEVAPSAEAAPSAEVASSAGAVSADADPSGDPAAPSADPDPSATPATGLDTPAPAASADDSPAPASPASAPAPSRAPSVASPPPAASSPRSIPPRVSEPAAPEEPPSLLDLFGLEAAPFEIEVPRGPDLRGVADDLYAQHAGRRVPFRELLVDLADAGLAPEQVRTALGFLKRDRRAAYRSLDADGAEVDFLAEPAAPPPPPAPKPRKARKPVPGVLGLFDEPEPELEDDAPPSPPDSSDAPLTLADAIGFEDAMGLEDAGLDDVPSAPDPDPAKKPRRRKAE